MTPYANEIIREYQCDFSTIDHKVSIQQVLENKWEYNNDVVSDLHIFKKAYHSIKSEPLYGILIKFGVPKKLD